MLEWEPFGGQPLGDAVLPLTGEGPTEGGGPKDPDGFLNKKQKALSLSENCSTV